MTQPDATTIAFIGLGNMGTPMTGKLIESGFAVQGFDLDERARALLTEAGGTAFPSAVEAVAGADLVILMLPNSAIVESVIESAEVQAALSDGAIVVDMSSSEPLRTRALADRLRDRAVHLVDAPVSGGVSGARSGSLTIMLGGDDELAARVTPVLETMGRVRHAGPVGAGHAAKALNNLMSATHLWITSEAMVAGMRFGLDPATMLTIFNGSSGRSGSTENKWPNFVLTESYASGFGLRLMLKDMKIAVELAHQLDSPIGLGDDAVGFWSQVAEELDPAADHTEVARWIGAHADLPATPATSEGDAA